MPLINAKLPNELKLLISRKFENEVWLLSDPLKHLKIELVLDISIQNVLKVIVIIDLQRPPF